MALLDARPAGALIPQTRDGLLTLVTALAQPRIAGLAAFVVYFLRAAMSPNHFGHTNVAYFNLLADAFLHGQLDLRLTPWNTVDLVHYGGKLYPYWPPFPAILITPLVAIFGVGVSDVLYTVVLGALSIALLARLLLALDETGIAPLDAARRGIIVATCAFGSVLLILSPIGAVWYSAQIIGWVCVLCATVAALTRTGKLGYFLAGLAFACALATRLPLLFNGVWLAYYLLRRDWSRPTRERLTCIAVGLLPIVVALALMGWYNTARFGSPTELGLAWHQPGAPLRDEFATYGAFNLHYLPKNLYYQFVGHPFLLDHQLIATDPRTENPLWMGGGLFWMTPLFLAAPYAAWRGRREPLVWALLLSCVLIYIPIGLLMGTGYLTFGPRYLLDLFVPLLVLTALGVRRWRLDLLQLLMIVGWLTYAAGSALWLLADRV